MRKKIKRYRKSPMWPLVKGILLTFCPAGDRFVYLTEAFALKIKINKEKQTEKKKENYMRLEINSMGLRADWILWKNKD